MHLIRSVKVKTDPEKECRRKQNHIKKQLILISYDRNKICTKFYDKLYIKETYLCCTSIQFYLTKTVQYLNKVHEWACSLDLKTDLRYNKQRVAIFEKKIVLTISGPHILLMYLEMKCHKRRICVLLFYDRTYYIMDIHYKLVNKVFFYFFHFELR